MTLPYRERPDVLTVPLQSEPPWLQRAIVGSTAGSLALCAALFHKYPVSDWLALFPGMTLSVLVGSLLAVYGRRRGGTLSLEVQAEALNIRDGGRKQRLITLSEPFGAVLLVDPKNRRRLLALGQRADTLVLLEDGGASAEPASGRWQDRSRAVDLGGVAISSASAGAAALVPGHSLDALLARLEPELEPEYPWVQHTVSGGEVLAVSQGVIQLGSLAVPRGEQPSRVYVVALKGGGAVAAVGLPSTEDTLLLLASEEAPVPLKVPPVELAPNAWLPLPVYELVRAVTG
ncbi:MAG: hypothetical protein HY909_16580 [Deltaproteobacteria bacterium]|nr:hypothetical protein [Deltaproteobacteria bacterium]